MVFFKGIQQQNVIGGKYKHAFFTSYLMALFEVAVVSTVVVVGWSSIVPIGTGGALGIITAMYIFRRYHK
jgi:uncharacterized membrane protein